MGEPEGALRVLGRIWEGAEEGYRSLRKDLRGTGGAWGGSQKDSGGSQEGFRGPWEALGSPGKDLGETGRPQEGFGVSQRRFGGIRGISGGHRMARAALGGREGVWGVPRGPRYL